MPKGEQTQLIIAEHLFEARFRPIGSFLDVRGHVADHVSAAFGIPQWRIDQHTINFHDVNEGIDKIGAFVSFRNAGLEAHDAPTRNFFEDKAEAFWKAFQSFSGFEIPQINRLGVRTKAFLKLDLPFEKIEQTLTSKLLTSDAVSIFGSKPADFGVVVGLEEKGLKLRIQLGPFKKKEVQQFFRFKSEHFESAGVLVDCDVYSDELQDAHSVPKNIRAGAKLAWLKTDNIFDKLGL